jgi:iron complex outermembrane recepter protein
LQFSVRVRQEVPLGDYRSFVQAGAQHIGNSYSATGNVNSYDQPGYTTYDVAAGISKGAWDVQLFCQNLTDVNASTNTNSNQQVLAETVTRPRIAGMRFGYRF